ncbi:MAG TPA: DUF559 domain-containing protein [Baekduia sp.]|nr:DUF559 domain-containing protein [Baekduia sp.]
MVDTADLRALGFTRSAMQVRRGRRSLTRLHRGVHRVGAAPLRFEGHVLAAVKAIRSPSAVAVASHPSAAMLLDLERGLRWDPVHVTVAAPGRRSRRTIRVHPVARIPPEDLTVVRGVPCTTWARTAVDLGESGNRRRVERLLDQAVVAELYDEAELTAVVARHRTRIGAALLLEVLGAHTAGSTLTDSDLEELFYAICRDEEFPRPLFQERIGEWRADASWPQYGVVVELDGGRYHASADRRRRDRRKDTALRRRGRTVLRFDAYDLTVGAKETGHEVRTALRAGGWSGGS